MSSFFEYLKKDGAFISIPAIFLGVIVIITSAVVFSNYVPNVILMVLGILIGVLIIITGSKYSKFKREGN